MDNCQNISNLPTKQQLMNSLFHIVVSVLFFASMPQKLAKYRLKFFFLCCSSTSYVMNILPYHHRLILQKGIWEWKLPTSWRNLLKAPEGTSPPIIFFQVLDLLEIWSGKDSHWLERWEVTGRRFLLWFWMRRIDMSPLQSTYTCIQRRSCLGVLQAKS